MSVTPTNEGTRQLEDLIDSVRGLYEPELDAALKLPRDKALTKRLDHARVAKAAKLRKGEVLLDAAVRGVDPYFVTFVVEDTDTHVTSKGVLNLDESLLLPADEVEPTVPPAAEADVDLDALVEAKVAERVAPILDAIATAPADAPDAGPDGPEPDTGANGDSTGAADTPAEPWDGYDSEPAKDVAAKIANGDLDADTLGAIRAYEAAGKDRATVLKAVDAALTTPDD